LLRSGYYIGFFEHLTLVTVFFTNVTTTCILNKTFKYGFIISIVNRFNTNVKCVGADVNALHNNI